MGAGRAGKRHNFLAKCPLKLVRLISEGIHFSKMASSPYFFSGSPVPGGVGLWADPAGLAWLWGKVFSPAKPNAIKNAIYECGLESKGDAWMQFRSAYYLYAIIFLIFDVKPCFCCPLRWLLRG